MCAVVLVPKLHYLFFVTAAEDNDSMATGNCVILLSDINNSKEKLKVGMQSEHQEK